MFITLTLSYGNKTKVFNTYNIVYIETSAAGSTIITLVNGEIINVNETIERIYALIKEAKFLGH